MEYRSPTVGHDTLEQAHQAIRDQLADYVTVGALGHEPHLTFPEVAVHLEICMRCRAYAEELLKLTWAAYSGEMDAATNLPPPDLSFLPTPPQASAQRPWLIDELGRLVVVFSEGLLKALQQPSLAGSMRGQLMYRYAQEPRAMSGLDIAIEMFADEKTPGQSSVRVMVDAGWRDPLAQHGTEVVLRTEDHVWRSLTDESGYATFNAVPLAMLPKLRVEITPPNKDAS